MKRTPYLLAVALSACAYSFSGANVGPHRTIHVPVFENLTAEPGIRERLTTQVTTAILEDNNLKITDRTGADVVLIGKITNLEDVPFTFEGTGSNFTTNDYKITVQVSVRYETVRDKKIIWEEMISGIGRYTLQGTKRRSDGLDEAIQIVAQNILNKVVSNW